MRCGSSGCSRPAYHSDMRIERDGDLMTLDIRPSDAFVLAILFDCPIFLTDRLLRLLDQQTTSK
jgi:bifunctional DNase/RNase